MDRWLIFMKERLPIPVLLLLSIGSGLSSLSLDDQKFEIAKVLLGFLQPGLFLLTLRLMDEVKDVEKDKLVHPDRPLPRGLLSLTEVTGAIYLGLACMALVVLILVVMGFESAAALYAFSTAYLWLMYKEFFIGSWLEKSPILYAFTHQIIMLPLAASIRAMNLDTIQVELLFVPSLMFLGVFFTIEICRKLDPAAHPALRTYRYHYGQRKTLYLVLATTALTLGGTWLLYADALFSAACLSLVALSVPLSYGLALQKNFKLVEGIAALSLLVHIWWPFLRHVISGL